MVGATFPRTAKRVEAPATFLHSWRRLSAARSASLAVAPFAFFAFLRRDSGDDLATVLGSSGGGPFNEATVRLEPGG
jgi:hypothetical protein